MDPTHFYKRLVSCPSALFHRGIKFLMSFSALWLVVHFQACYIIDDDNINAICTSDCTTIQGRFTTRDGHTPVANMRLQFDWHTMPQMSALTGMTRKIATAKTDENGYYTITFFAEDNELGSPESSRSPGLYSLIFHVPDTTYMTMMHRDYFEFILDKRDTVVTRDYHIPKLDSKIYLKVTNAEAMKDDDRIGCHVKYRFDNVDEERAVISGTLDSDHSLEGTYKTASDQYTYLHVFTKKNGVYSNYTDSVMIAPGETGSYEVAFK